VVLQCDVLFEREEEDGVAIAKGTSNAPVSPFMPYNVGDIRREKGGNRRGIVLASKVGDEW
jgi:hypothetical protein